MSATEKARYEAAAAYIADNFRPSDRLAVVLLNKRTDSVIQRLSSAERIAAPDFQAWLRHENAHRYEVYVSMNALAQEARGRTKGDVAEIRHVYLDFDENGTQAVEGLFKRQDLPQPNHLVNSSPDKWQVIWKVEGFGKDQAETLQRNLARDCAADPAATDCARVLRLPGFYNHKYARPHLIRSELHATAVYRPEQFPAFPADERGGRLTSARGGQGNRSPAPGNITQSERDWAFAKRALARGESPDLVIAAIATYRRYDKHNPRDYAARTVRKAGEALEAEHPTDTTPDRP